MMEKLTLKAPYSGRWIMICDPTPCYAPFFYQLIHAPEIDGIDVTLLIEADSDTQKWFPTLKTSMLERVAEKEAEYKTSLSGIRILIERIKVHPEYTNAAAVNFHGLTFVDNLIRNHCVKYLD